MMFFAQEIGEKLKSNYLPLVVLDDNYIPSCTSAYSVLPLCEVTSKSSKQFKRSCAYDVFPKEFEKKSMSNYLPLVASNDIYILSCISPYTVLPLCEVASKSFKQFKRSCAYEIIFALGIREKSKSNYLPLLVSDDFYIPSCTSAYSVLPLSEVASKSVQQFRRSCAYKVKVDRRTDRQTDRQTDRHGDSYIPP